SYLDSGTNAILVNDNSLTQCVAPSLNVGFFCQNPAAAESATLRGSTATSATASFSIGDADMMNGAFTALPELGAPSTDPQGVDPGLPFFFGHNVYNTIEMHNAPGGTPPYFAY